MIKRYEADHEGESADGYESVVVKPDGDFVTYEDHAAEVARLNEQVRALAAENADMRNAFDQTIGWQESVDAENTESVRMLVDLKTPATDAILREVGARAVEGFAEFCGEENSVFVEAKAYYRSLPDAAAEFAARIRAGEVQP